jgi:glucose/arabinose dehydrogenase
VLPNGDVLIAEASTIPDRDTSKAEAQQLKEGDNMLPSANRIILLRDADGNGQADLRHVFLQDLNQPFGMR